MKKIFILFGVLAFVSVSTVYLVENVNKIKVPEEISDNEVLEKEQIEEISQTNENGQIKNELSSEVQEQEVKEQESVKHDTITQSNSSKDNSKIEKIELPKKEQTKEPPIISSKEESKQESENKQEQIVEETPKKPEIDEEYERLKAQVQYSTYEECMNAGFEIALSDTVNILGFDPIEIIYKGKVIGYILQINYTNPMEQ